MDEPKPTVSPPSPSTRVDPEAAQEAEPGSAVPPSLPPPPPPPRKVAQAKWALLAMAFFMADVGNAIGPFLGVFLQGHGWAPGLIGSVMTAGGVATLVASAPIGALIDATNHKRALAVGGTAVASAALVATLLGPRLPPLTFSAQVVGQVAGSLLMPSLVAMTLGVAGGGADGFARLNGRNQAANHAGNMAGAGLSALLGQRYGLPAVFYLSWGFAAATVAAALCVPRGAGNLTVAPGGPCRRQISGAAPDFIRQHLALVDVVNDIQGGSLISLDAEGVLEGRDDHVAQGSLPSIRIRVAQPLSGL
ncbi:hypothetical protein GGTG_11827 [Gaeumannomyces tritici R3-111a-1]|uniref:Major facilitator superfamily (MFS) profile domain-containing protein n=1 Tax=Gaeumannomyces tritici (strain R3-111a-1) TaxID=644352 RepID=J3PEA4_GAET3|nr:hypothetical protein GGTG_11827 [Gaeumannomyces tritici R3-111a-1]EJT70804.1 hypothetical protein GGTG_11827 [Gaeumannomyces tritici R3-111a-1]